MGLSLQEAREEYRRVWRKHSHEIVPPQLLSALVKYCEPVLRLINETLKDLPRDDFLEAQKAVSVEITMLVKAAGAVAREFESEIKEQEKIPDDALDLLKYSVTMRLVGLDQSEYFRRMKWTSNKERTQKLFNMMLEASIHICNRFCFN